MENSHSFPTFFDLTNSLLETDNKMGVGSTTASIDEQAKMFAFSMTSLDEDVKPSLIQFEDSEYEPTVVLLFKKVPYDASEADIVRICNPFGVVSDIYLMRSKNYALVEFKELDSAVACFETYRKFEPKVKSQNVFVFYTGKKDIYKPENTTLIPPSRYLLFSFNTESEIITTVIVNDILSNFGKVLKMHIVPTQPPMAYVEMEDIGAAILAKQSLHDNVYADTIHLQVTFMTKKLFDHYCQSSTELCLPTSHSFNHFNRIPPGLNLFIKSEGHVDSIESPFNLLQNDKEKNTAQSTVMVKNLPKGVSLQQLFKLFGCYGNVMKIKIFFSNPENALVEFQDSTQAMLAKTHLNNCPFRGNILFVVQSKNPIIINTPYIPETNKFLADFSDSKEHRYRIAGSKNFRNIARPSAVIHLSNICEDKEQLFYHILFKDCGRIKRSYFLKGEGKGLLVEMESVDQAVEVLINFHNFNIDGKFLKVSFSKYQKIKD